MRTPLEVRGEYMFRLRGEARAEPESARINMPQRHAGELNQK